MAQKLIRTYYTVQIIYPSNSGNSTFEFNTLLEMKEWLSHNSVTQGDAKYHFWKHDRFWLDDTYTFSTVHTELNAGDL